MKTAYYQEAPLLVSDLEGEAANNRLSLFQSVKMKEYLNVRTCSEAQLLRLITYQGTYQ